MTVLKWERPDGYRVSDDPALIDRDRVYRWVSELTYWAQGRGRATFERSLDNSLCLGSFATTVGRLVSAAG